MNLDMKLTIAGAGSILAFDVIEALTSVHFRVPFAVHALATLSVYFGLAYWAARHLFFRGTVIFGAFLGLVDATAGWKVCALLGADEKYRLEEFTFGRWCQMVILVMAFGAFLALIAYLIASRRNGHESR